VVQRLLGVRWLATALVDELDQSGAKAPHSKEALNPFTLKNPSHL